jgi:uncharacterized protein (DUF2147 family)
MKKLLLLVTISLIALNVFSQNNIVGKWHTVKKNSIVEIYQSNGIFYGKITSIATHAKSIYDEHNPDPKLRNRSMVGVVILKDFIYKDGEWINGTIYNPVNGKTYSCEMWIDENGNLNIRGYVLFFYNTQIWTRIK